MLSVIFQLFVIQFLIWSTCSLSILPESRCGVCRKNCGAFEERRICGPSCPMTCDTLNTNVCCDIRCVSGCFCEDGYILLTNTGPRQCVPINNCPKPGILEFANHSVIVLESMKTVTILVLRINGTAGVVTVQWHTVEGTARENVDFIPASGDVVFPEGVTLQTITIEIVDDAIREPDKVFTVVLSDPTNKAEINPRRLEGITVIVKDDDMKPGYIEVESTMIEVYENIGTVDVTLIRLEGADGLIRIKYRTVDGTARETIDYVPVAGEVIFNEGETRKIISLTIVDDDSREPVENIRLQLFDPSAADDVINFRSLSSRLETIITIKDNDMTPGYLELEEVNITVRESDDRVQISVVRLGGTDGILQLKYKTEDGTATMSLDYQQQVGDMVFKDGESKKIISITILNDNMRESMESFQLQIYDISPGFGTINFRSLGTRLITLITIIDDDAKPGFVQFERNNITVREDVGIVEIPVIRVDGTDGSLLVKYKALIGSAISLLDFAIEDGDLLFNDGVNRLTIEIKIIDDRIKEPDETFNLLLYEPDGIQGRTGQITSLQITITDNDNRPGVFEFQTIRMSVPEKARTLSIVIIRKDGSDGLVTLQIRTRSGTAIEGIDYNSPPLTIDFPDGITEQRLHIQIIDDNVKENNENFFIGIFNPTNGGSLGKINLLTVVIMDDDEPSVIRFSRRSGNFRENDGIVEIPVIRENGLDRRVGVHWKTEDQTAVAGEDYREVSDSFIIFEPNERTKTIQIVIFDDSRFESNELFDVVLFNPSPGAVLGIPSRYTVELADNDARVSSLPPLPSVSYELQVYFSKQTIRVVENAGEVLISIIRSGPMIRFTVQIQTSDGSATGGSDYRPTRGNVPFEEDDAEVEIAIRIIDDDVFEPDETFTVELFNPTSGTIPFGLNIVTIIIEDDDGDTAFRRNDGSPVTSNTKPPPRPTPGSTGPFLLTKCPGNLILKPCANTCPPTCDSTFGKVPCSDGSGCIRGCFCPDGLVKESESSERCIKPSQCPSRRPPCSRCAGSSPRGLL